MKNVLVIAGVFVGAVLAAVLAWAVVGGDGGVRRAALVEPTSQGSIGALTIEGVDGATAIPVRSFNWHAEYAVTHIRYDPLEVLRDGGEGSPEIFGFVTGGTIAPSASLDLTAPGSELPYLRYSLVNARGMPNGHAAGYRAGKYEKFGLRYSSMDVRVGQRDAPEPVPDPSDVVGFMTLRDQRVPILAFDVALVEPGNINAVIRRPLDRLADTLKDDLVAQTNLGSVTVELQRPREGEPYVIYRLEMGVRVDALTDSAAAGIAPVEEVRLNFGRLRVTHGSSSACYPPVTC